MNNILSFLTKLLISILFTFILLEIGLRLFPGLIPLNLLALFNEEPRAEIAQRQELFNKKSDTAVVERDDGGREIRIYKPFTKNIWSIEENGTTITAVMDEMGFCNLPENSYQLPAIDIIVLGDSFTACHAVSPQDSWANQLSMLTGLTVYNLGRIGLGIHEYIQLLKKFGLQKSPRLVIMNVYEGNDFRDARHHYDYVQNEAAQAETTTSTGLPYYLSLLGGDLLERHSYAANLIRAFANHIYNIYLNSSETAKVEVDFRYQLLFSDDMSVPFNPENVDGDEVRNAMYLTSLQADSGVFQVIEEALKNYVEHSRRYDFVPIVTYTPSAHTTYAEYVSFDDPKLEGLMKSFSHEQRAYLRQQGVELGYVFIDLTPYLQAAAQLNGAEELLYYQRDLHLTPAGHAAVAKALNQALQDLEFIIE